MERELIQWFSKKCVDTDGGITANVFGKQLNLGVNSENALYPMDKLKG